MCLCVFARVRARVLFVASDVQAFVRMSVCAFVCLRVYVILWLYHMNEHKYALIWRCTRSAKRIIRAFP